jgi:multiple sugar transport system permease protein
VRGEAVRGWRFAAPAALALAAVALFPLLATAWLSLRRVVLVFGEDTFTGLANYRAMVADARFWGALGHTGWFTVVSVAVELLLGLPLALVLHRAGRGGGLLRASALVPWALPTVVAARLWAWLLNPDYGLVERLLPAPPLALLGSPSTALLTAALVDAWKTTPFVALILLAGLQGIPAEVEQAARVDGASGWRSFRSITLPLLRPSILLALLFRSLDAFRVFDVVFVLTEGGPGHATEPLSLYAYKTLLRAGSFGYGSALSVVTFLCVVVIGLGWLALLGRQREGGS